jgi:D-inositol-3-phosphate glycosyltransferase
LIASSGCDLVIANTAGVFPAVDAAIEVGVPVVWAVHESFDPDVFAYLNWGADGLHPEIREQWLASFAKADLVVFESEATKVLYENHFPGLTGRCIRYGIDLTSVAEYESTHDRTLLRAQAGFTPADRVLLCMGVFQERKAQLALVQAFAGVARAMPNARLVLVGEHPTDYAMAVRRAVSELGLDGSVRIEAIAPDTYRWYHCADVLVSASDTESLPRSVLESMAFGVPVLASDVFGLAEVITDGVNGWLCSARDGVALTAGLRRVFAATDTELAAMTARCRAEAQSFDGAHYAAAFAELIENAHDIHSAG